MRRREFITAVGGSVTWSLAARAQQLAGVPRVIQLAPVQIQAQIDATRRILRELGYVEGRNIRLEFRDAAGNVDALPAVAQELVRDGAVDAIIAVSTPAALAAYAATRTIPIVAFTAVDPVASGLADSLGHPGRNVTGIAVFSEETTVKRVELMREVVPRAVRLGTVTTKLTSGAQSLAPVLETGRKLGFMVEPINVDDPADLAKALSPEVLDMIKSSVADAKSHADTPQGRRELETTAMMLEEPNVDLRELGKIQAPTLVLSADHDLILLSHTIDIYNHIPNGQLAIFPNALHTIPFDDPATFNAAVDRFLRTPFVRKKSLDDTMKSIERLRAAQPTH